MPKYIYIYKEETYNTYVDLIQHPDFKDVSFPIDENVMSEEALADLGITRQVYEKPLSLAKDQKLAELVSARNGVEVESVELPEVGVFEFDDISQKRLTNAMNALESATSTRDWTLENGTIVTISKAQIAEIFNIAAQRSDDAFDKLKDLKAQVAAATTVAEVEAIKWDDEE